MKTAPSASRLWFPAKRRDKFKAKTELSASSGLVRKPTFLQFVGDAVKDDGLGSGRKPKKATTQVSFFLQRRGIQPKSMAAKPAAANLSVEKKARLYASFRGPSHSGTIRPQSTATLDEGSFIPVQEEDDEYKDGSPRGDVAKSERRSTVSGGDILEDVGERGLEDERGLDDAATKTLFRALSEPNALVQGKLHPPDLRLKRIITRRIHRSGVSITCVAICPLDERLKEAPKGSAVVLGDAQGRLYYWPLVDSRHRTIVQAHHTGLTCLSWAPKGQFIASGCEDGRISLGKVRNGHLHLVGWYSMAHPNGVSSLCWMEAFARAEEYPWLISGGKDGCVKSWSIKTNSKSRRALVQSEEGREVLFRMNNAQSFKTEDHDEPGWFIPGPLG